MNPALPPAGGGLSPCTPTGVPPASMVCGEDDFQYGLPGPLPPGERVIWQGAPDWQILAQRTFHVRKLAIYFAFLLMWYAATLFVSAEETRAALLAILRMTAIASVPLALVCVFAWLSSRTTVYTITDRRVVLSVGVALQMSINLPLKRVESAAVSVDADGHGSIVLTLTPGEKLAYLALWPHARPWRMAHAEPMLRCIPNAADVSQLLARALAAAAGMQVQATKLGASSEAGRRAHVSALA